MHGDEIMLLQWKDEIRADLRLIVPPEPDTRDGTVLKMKFRFPDGNQVCRSFTPSCSVKVHVQYLL